MVGLIYEYTDTYLYIYIYIYIKRRPVTHHPVSSGSGHPHFFCEWNRTPCSLLFSLPHYIWLLSLFTPPSPLFTCKCFYGKFQSQINRKTEQDRERESQKEVANPHTFSMAVHISLASMWGRRRGSTLLLPSPYSPYAPREDSHSNLPVPKPFACSF